MDLTISKENPFVTRKAITMLKTTKMKCIPTAPL